MIRILATVLFGSLQLATQAEQATSAHRVNPAAQESAEPSGTTAQGAPPAVGNSSVLAQPAVVMHYAPQVVTAAMERLEAEETLRRRKYYDYLRSRGPVDETFEVHLSKYGLLARTPGPATTGQLRRLEERAGMALPGQLREFYLFHGGMRLGSIGAQAFDLPSPEQLLRRLDLDTGWERFASLGLIDMARASWGHDRYELDPAGGIFSAAELSRANREIRCVGWFNADEGDAYDYLCFGRNEQLFLAHYHQDDIQAFKARIHDLLAGNGLPVSLSELLGRKLEETRSALAMLDDDE